MWYVPGLSNLCEKLSLVPKALEWKRPVSLTTVCGSSFTLTQLPVEPDLTVTDIGVDIKPFSRTLAESAAETVAGTRAPTPLSTARPVRARDFRRGFSFMCVDSSGERRIVEQQHTRMSDNSASVRVPNVVVQNNVVNRLLASPLSNALDHSPGKPHCRHMQENRSVHPAPGHAVRLMSWAIYSLAQMRNASPSMSADTPLSSSRLWSDVPHAVGDGGNVIQ